MTSPGVVTDGGSNRRRELLGLAAVVFAEKGIVNTTVRDIAETAGILSGSLYHHFNSKDQMIAEILQLGLREAMVRDAAAIEAAADPVVALRELITGFVDWVARHPEVATILGTDRQYVRDAPALVEVERDRRNNLALWVEVIQEGIDNGVFTNAVTPDLSARAIFAGLFDSVRWLPPVGTSTAEEVGAQLADLFVGGLQGPR